MIFKSIEILTCIFFIIGTNLLRAYMHGFFVDIRLYRKAKSVAQPFAFEEYKKKKIREKIEETRENRVKLQVSHLMNIYPFPCIDSLIDCGIRKGGQRFECFSLSEVYSSIFMIIVLCTMAYYRIFLGAGVDFSVIIAN